MSSYSFKYYIRQIITLFCVMMASLCCVVNADEQSNASERVAVFDVAKGRQNLLPYIDIKIPEGDYDTFEHRALGKYIPLSQLSNNLGFYNKPIWIRFSVERVNNKQIPHENVYLEFEMPTVDYVTLYAPQQDGSYKIVETGDEVLFSSREISYRNFLFSLPKTNNKYDTYYLRVQSKSSVQLPLVLWSETKLLGHVDKSAMLIGGYFSFLSVLMIMSFVSFFHFKQRVFIYYIAYLAAYSFLQFSLNGLSYQYFWHAIPEYSSKINILSIGLSIISAMFFCMEYLQINYRSYPRVFPAALLFLSVVIAACGIAFYGPLVLGIRLLILCGMLLLPSILYVSYLAHQNGVKRAKLFVLAWLFLLVGVFISGLHYLGLIPFSPCVFYSMPVGSLLEMTILCVTTIISIGELRREKEQLSERASEYLKQLHFKVDEMVSQRTQQLEELNTELEKKASLDSMTGLLNHSAVKRFLDVAKRDALEKREDLAIILVDIDEFKEINDSYGHPAGDDVIRTVSMILEATVRRSDYCGRYGGDEFLLILPNANIDNAIRISESIREKVDSMVIPSVKDHKVSVSIGVSTLRASNNNLIEEADEAMYRSKQQGRNQVSTFD